MKKMRFASLGGGLAPFVAVTVSAAPAGAVIVCTVAVIGALVVGAVEAGAFEDHSGAGSDLPVELVLPALWTALEGLVLHGLEFFEFVAAAMADVSVCRHLRNLSFLFFCCSYNKNHAGS